MSSSPERGVPVAKRSRTFSSFIFGLEALADWLWAEGITEVVMEATGQYRKPV